MKLSANMTGDEDMDRNRRRIGFEGRDQMHVQQFDVRPGTLRPMAVSYTHLDVYKRQLHLELSA